MDTLDQPRQQQQQQRGQRYSARKTKQNDRKSVSVGPKSKGRVFIFGLHSNFSESNFALIAPAQPSQVGRAGA